MAEREVVFIEHVREVALFHARHRAYANGRGFVLRPNLSSAARGSLQQAALAFSRWAVPDHLMDASAEAQAFHFITPDHTHRWYDFTLTDVAPRTDALDHFESREQVQKVIEGEVMPAADDR